MSSAQMSRAGAPARTNIRMNAEPLARCPLACVDTSPYRGRVDFHELHAMGSVLVHIDRVSLADILRNAFVYPPHTIFEQIKVAPSGFDPSRSLLCEPRYRFEYSGEPQPEPAVLPTEAWIDSYHRRLCEVLADTTASLRSPWLLQSGGRDAISLAIGLARVRPDASCLTYLGSQEEKGELAAARHVARSLGLRHETLVCQPGRAYDRYLALVPRLPLLSGDFAMLSYADLATEIHRQGGDGVIDGLGSDIYLGMSLSRHQRVMAQLACEMALPGWMIDLAWVTRSFTLSCALGTLQMNAFERSFPGSRFTDAEVDHLLDGGYAALSRQRLRLFQDEIAAADTDECRHRIAINLAEAGGAIAKGMYTTIALGLQLVYPYCDARLSEWMFRHVPMSLRMDPSTHTDKILIRHHIARRFADLPYVDAGRENFHFDFCGLAAERFDQVHAFAVEASEIMPGAVAWLEAHARHLANNYVASKFYLLAVTLPWLLSRTRGVTKARSRRRQAAERPMAPQPLG